MPYLILDLEMSGTESGFHDIIQIGAVLTDNNWNKLSEFESLVYPDNPESFSIYSEKIHGISINDLEDAPAAYDVIESFENWIKQSLKRDTHDRLTDVIICGQSVINDIVFFKNKYKELNLHWPFQGKMLDLISITFIISKIHENNNIAMPKSHSLNSIANFFNIEREDVYHDALDDAKITYECFKCYLILIEKLKFC